MRKWYIRLFILIAYCIPYAFLAIYGDAMYRTMLLYGVIAVAFFVLYRLCIRSHNVVVFFIGNILSLLVSLLTARLTHLEKMEWYFKPFTSQSLLLTISIAVFAIQLIAAAIYFRKQKH